MTYASIIRDRDQITIGSAILTETGVSRYLEEAKHAAITLSVVTGYIEGEVVLDPEFHDTDPSEPVMLGWTE